MKCLVSTKAFSSARLASHIRLRTSGECIRKYMVWRVRTRRSRRRLSPLLMHPEKHEEKEMTNTNISS